jgi:hypothetical protein
MMKLFYFKNEEKSGKPNLSEESVLSYAGEFSVLFFITKWRANSQPHPSHIDSSIFTCAFFKISSILLNTVPPIRNSGGASAVEAKS